VVSTPDNTQTTTVLTTPSRVCPPLIHVWYDHMSNPLSYHLFVISIDLIDGRMVTTDRLNDYMDTHWHGLQAFVTCMSSTWRRCFLWTRKSNTIWVNSSSTSTRWLTWVYWCSRGPLIHTPRRPKSGLRRSCICCWERTPISPTAERMAPPPRTHWSDPYLVHTCVHYVLHSLYFVAICYINTFLYSFCTSNRLSYFRLLWHYINHCILT